MNYKVVKRNGSIVPFEISKINEAIRKAFIAQNTFCDLALLDDLACKVKAKIEADIQGETLSVEQIKDYVETVLIQSDHSNVERAYRIYNY